MNAAVTDVIRDMVRKSTGKKVPGVEPWPGCPIGHFSVVDDTLRQMVASGELEIVGRPAKTDPNRVALFVRFTKQ